MSQKKQSVVRATVLLRAIPKGAKALIGTSFDWNKTALI